MESRVAEGRRTKMVLTIASILVLAVELAVSKSDVQHFA